MILLVDLSDYIKKDTSTCGFSSDLTMNNPIISGLKSGSNIDDAINKKQLDNALKTKANKNELNNYLKTDGSNKVLGLLNMDNRRIENVGNGRHNANDALTHAQLELFNLDLNVDDGKIEAQNPIDMGNKKISRLQNPRLNNNDAMSYKFYTDNFVKPGFNNDIDCNGKRFYNVGNYTNNNQLITGIITEDCYLRKDQSTINMNTKRVTNARTPISNNDLASKSYVDTRSSNVDLSDYL